MNLKSEISDFKFEFSRHRQLILDLLRDPEKRRAHRPFHFRQRAVIVRHFAGLRISDYLRITVGTGEQTDRLLSALSDIMDGA